MAKSKRERCFAAFRYSDPGWTAEVVPIAGSTDVAIVVTRMDSYTGQKRYGRVLERFCSRKTAEKLCGELNEFKSRLLATAFP